MNYLQARPGYGTISPVETYGRAHFLLPNNLILRGSSATVTLGDMRPVSLDTLRSNGGTFAFSHKGEIVMLGRKYSVYIIESSSGHYKIGYSNNPRRRLQEIQKEFAQEPYLFDLTFYWVCGSKDAARYVEQQLHSQLSGSHAWGEWFSLNAQEFIVLSDLVEMALGEYQREKGRNSGKD